MDTFMKADVFFFVTTLAVVLVSTVLIIALVYLIKVLRDVKDLIRDVKEEAESIMDDFEDFKQNISAKAKFFSKFVGAVTSATFIQNILRPKDKPRKNVKYEQESSDED